MSEVIYFEDELVTVTSTRIRLGEKEYALVDVKSATVRGSSPGWTIGGVHISASVAVTILAVLSFLFYVILYLLVGALAPKRLDLFSYAFVYLLPCIVTAGALFFVFQYVVKSGHYTYKLNLVLVSGLDTSFSSPDAKYLAQIANAINRALKKAPKSR